MGLFEALMRTLRVASLDTFYLKSEFERRRILFFSHTYNDLRCQRLNKIGCAALTAGTAVFIAAPFDVIVEGYNTEPDLEVST